MAVKPIPEGQHSLTPYLAINDAAKAIEFYKKPLARSKCSAWKPPADASAMPS